MTPTLAVELLGEPLAVARARAVENLSDHAIERACVCALLAMEHSKGDASLWHPYVSMLPPMKYFRERALTWCTDKAVLSCLSGTDVLAAVEKQQQQVHDSFRFLAAPLAELVSEGAAIFSAERWDWANAVLFSRAILIPRPAPSFGGFTTQSIARGRTVEALVPLVDFLNHRPGTLCDLADSKKCIQLLYGKTIDAGEEIFLNYGPRSNTSLLAHFGFTLKSNPCDQIVIEVGGEQHMLHLNIVPPRLLERLRLLACDEDESAGGVRWREADCLYDGLSSVQDLLLEPHAVTNDTVGRVLNHQNERAMLARLDQLLREKDSHLVACASAVALCGDSEQVHDCREYLMGQRNILASAIAMHGKLCRCLLRKVEQSPMRKRPSACGSAGLDVAGGFRTEQSGGKRARRETAAPTRLGDS